MFENKVFLITGGGTGIGKEVARRVLAGGGRVVLNGRRKEVLESAAAELDPTGGKVAYVAGSIADPAISVAMVETALDRFGRLDVLINNAGIFKPTPFVDHTIEDFNAYVDIILRGTFFATQAVVPVMKAQGGGAVVNVGSMWADHAVGATPSSAYSAAKAGVHALTRNLALELAGDRIRVNTVAPAVVETPVYETFMSPEEIAEVLPTFNAFHPIGRNGLPKDVAQAILFLAGEEADWITGAVLPVDGGVTAGRP